MTRFWVYKCNASNGSHQRSWGDWTYVFDLPKNTICEWGRTDTIGSGYSKNLIRHEMREGDLVLAWQSDRHAALGLVQVAALEPDGDEIAMWLKPIQRFETIDPSARLEEAQHQARLGEGTSTRLDRQRVRDDEIRS